MIALPFMSELFWLENAKAAVPFTNKKLVTISFANGLPPTIANLGLTGPLASLKSLQNKIVVCRGVNASGSGSDAHDLPGLALFVGKKGNKKSNSSGGISMDYFAYQQLRPQTSVDVLAVNIGGRPKLARYIRSWRDGGSAGIPVYPVDNAEQLFSDMFGSPVPTTGRGDDEELRKQRLRLSVLDSIVDQYKSIVAPQSKYSADAKRKISSHLDRIYEVEKSILDSRGQLINMQQETDFLTWYSKIEQSHYLCSSPDPYKSPARGIYADSDRTLDKYQAINYPEWCWSWPLISEVYALGLATGYMHFGSMTNGFGGERYKNIGPEGNLEHHEYYHSYKSSGTSSNVREVVNWWVDQYVSRVAKTLQIFDSITEDNGKTLLDNTAVVIGTEHDYQHSNSDMTFFVAGRSDTFKSGQTFTGMTDVQLYNTVLNGLGINTRFGDASRDASVQSFKK